MQQTDQIVDGLRYQILDEEKKTAACTGCVSDDAVVNVPETVRIHDVEYQVIQISEDAFAGSDKLKEVTVEANVVFIEPKAFYQCKKLQKLTIYADHLQQIGADAFAKIHKKAQIFMIGEQTETFTALLSGTSVPITATVGFDSNKAPQHRCSDKFLRKEKDNNEYYECKFRIKRRWYFYTG